MDTAAFRLGAVVLLSALAAGCFSAKNPDANCNDVSEYQSSTEVPAIVIPKSLSAPTESGSFAVPPARQVAQSQSGQSKSEQPKSEQPKSEQQRVPGAACLARPPDFFRKDVPPAAK